MYRRTLENGFTFLCDPTGPAQVAAAYLWLDVGSQDEAPGMEGAAHMLEHMLFKGTASFGVGEVAAAVEGLGGDINAWTSFDETVYHITAPAKEIGACITILSEMLRSARLDAKELERERLVILEEIRGGQEDPDLVMAEAVYALAFGAHPYGRSVIGTVASVKGIHAEALQQFYKTWYQPANARLAVVGPVDLAAVEAQVEALFSGGGLRSVRPQYPIAMKSGKKRLKKRFEGIWVETAFAGPGQGHPDMPLLDVLATALGGGASAPLESELRIKQRLCLDTAAHYDGDQQAGTLSLQLHVAEGKLTEAVAAADQLLNQWAAEGPKAADIERAKAQIIADRAFSRESVDGRAHTLLLGEQSTGNPEAWRTYDAAVAAASPAQLQRVIETYLRPENAVRVVLAPPEEKLSLNLPRLEKKGLQRAALPSVQRHVLSNGLRVLLAPDAAEVVAVRLVGLGGMLNERASLAGRVSLWARSLFRGTAGMDLRHFAAEVEHTGGSMGAPNGRSTQSLKLDIPVGRAAEGLELLSLAAQYPDFLEAEIEKAREEQLQAIREEADHPDSMLRDRLWALSCPKHAFGLPPLGTAASVARLQRRHLMQLHQQWLSADQLVLSVAGGFDPELMLHKLNRFFGKIPKGGPPAQYLPPQFPQETQRKTIFVGREQASVGISFPGLSTTDAQQPALELLAAILGGQGGRLFMELREQHGLAYQVGASSQEGWVPGLMLCSLGTDPGRVDEAEKRLMESLHKAMSGISDAERERSKRYLLGAAETEVQSSGSRAAAAAYTEIYGQDGTQWRSLYHRVAAVTAAELAQVAQNCLTRPLAVVRVLPVRGEKG